MGFIQNLLQKQKKDSFFCTAVVAAAGHSSRMGGADKLFSEIDGIPLIVRTLLALEASDCIHEIIVVTREESILKIGDLCQAFGITKTTKIIKGGDNRTESVFRGVCECSEKTSLIAVHDGARPLVSQASIKAVVDRAAETGAAALAVLLIDTIRECSGDFFGVPADRERFRAMQTPQVFDADLLRGALQKALTDRAAITDDCGALERLGMKIAAVEGERENIKITTPVDIWIAEGILQGRESL